MKEGRAFVNDRPASSALRELRTHLAAPRTLAILAGAGLILGLAAPFDTDSLLGLPGRIAYWTAVAAVTWSIGYLVDTALSPVLRRRGIARPLRVLADGLVTGALITLAVAALNRLAFGTAPATATEWAVFAATLTAIATIVTAIGAVMSPPEPAPVPPGQSGPPPILTRLPQQKRGSLLSLSAEDHYVRVRTTGGEELVLMRLADAIAETPPVEGLRVHRSHWVAIAAVRTARRTGDRALLTLGDGAEIPVSRANLPRLRERGML